MIRVAIQNFLLLFWISPPYHVNSSHTTKSRRFLKNWLHSNFMLDDIVQFDHRKRARSGEWNQSEQFLVKHHGACFSERCDESSLKKQESKVSTARFEDESHACQLSAPCHEQSEYNAQIFSPANESKPLDIKCLLPQISPIPDFGQVAYLRSERYVDLAPNIERNGNRAALVESLIDAIGIPRAVDVFDVNPASRQQISHFHNSKYVAALENSQCLSNLELEQFGLIDDCPVFEDLFELVCLGKLHV